MKVEFSSERALESWCWLDTSRHRRVVGVDPDTESVVITGIVVATERSDPPRWIATASGLRVHLGRPGLPRDEETIDQILDALDLARGVVGAALADVECRLVPWRPLSRPAEYCIA